MPTHRRRDLLATVATLSVLAAGCLSEEEPTAERADDEGPATGADEPPADPSDSAGEVRDSADDRDAEDQSDEPSPVVGDGIEDAELFRYDHPRYPDEPSAAWLASAADVAAWIDDHEHLDQESELATALAETDFERSVVLAIEAGGRDLCQQLAVDELCLEDGRVVVRAVVREAPDAGELCAQQVIAVGAVLRVVPTDEAPDGGCVVVIDQDGTEHFLRVDGDRMEDDQADEIRTDDDSTDDSNCESTSSDS